MYPSILTVTSPAASHDLTTLAAVKLDLGISTSAEDAKIEAWIDHTSAAIENFCDRIFVVEGIREVFRDIELEKGDGLILQRYPLVTVTSIVEDGETLVVDEDYELDAKKGLVYRIEEDQRVSWCAYKVTINYTGGFSPIPTEVQRACIDMVKMQRSKSSRDPMLKSLTIPEIVTEGYWVGGVPGEKNSQGIPSDIAMMISRYVIRRVG